MDWFAEMSNPRILSLLGVVVWHPCLVGTQKWNEEKPEETQEVVETSAIEGHAAQRSDFRVSL